MRTNLKRSTKSGLSKAARKERDYEAQCGVWSVWRTEQGILVVGLTRAPMLVPFDKAEAFLDAQEEAERRFGIL
jgi:hypothetical protein